MLEFVGQRLGNNEILQWLGEGAHVHAFLARQEPSGTMVVVKILKAALANRADFFERFEREAQAAIAMDHPCMVKILDYNHQGDTFYLVEEFLPGGSLLDHLNAEAGALPTEQVIRTLDRLASVLDYAHQRGIIHRDLKPENVLFDNQGNAYLSDLGITKVIDPNAKRKHNDLKFGNPAYMAPEVWDASGADWRSDIYALGIILFEMLTGKLPFDDAVSGSMMFVHLMHVFSKPISLVKYRPDLPTAVDDVIVKAMAKDRQDRYQSAGELATAFKQALATTQVAGNS